LIRRFNYEKNSLWINQILGEHKVGDRSKLNWEFHTILLMEVCQTEFKTFLEMKIQVTNYQASQLLITIDTFKLKEDELAANASYDYKFNKMKRVIIRENHFGLNERIKSRGFQATQFNLKANSGSTNTVVDPNLDLFYNQNNFSNGAFLLPLSVETLKF
jgi:hypothetical protein